MANLTKVEAAERLRVTPRTLELWHAQNIGPARMTLGKNTVLYREEDIAAYERRHVRGGEVPEHARQTMLRAAQAFEIILRWPMRDEARGLITSVRNDLRAQIAQKKEA